MDPVAVLHGIWPPVLAALLLVGIGGGRFVGLALALGILVAAVLLEEVPRVPPENGQQGFLLGACLVAAISLLPARLDSRLRACMALAAGAVAGVLLLWFVSWSLLGKGVGVLGLIAFGPAAAKAAPRHLARATCAAWCICFAAAAFVLLAAGSGKYAQFAGAGSAAMGTAGVLTLWRPLRVDAGPAFAVAIAYGGWLLAGWALLPDPNLPAMVCALLAPLGMLFGRKPDTAGRRGPWLAYGTTVVLALTAVGLVLPTLLRTDF